VRIKKLTENIILEILKKYKTVAIVGVSRNPSKDSYRVAEYLKKQGFKIVPINPYANEILGVKCYKSLLDMPTKFQKSIEIVDFFRPPNEVLPIVEQVVYLKKLYGRPYVIWMQLGIINKQASDMAKKVGLTVIMNKCMMREHSRIFGRKIRENKTETK